VTVLRVRLLGEFGLIYGDQPVDSVNTPRLQSLLAYLILHRDLPLSRRQIAFLFWPDSSEAQARTNLRKLLYQLRQALPDSDRFLQTTGQLLQWRKDAPFSLDVTDFECSLNQSCSIQQLQMALELYRGDLLVDCYDDWILAERERLRQKCEKLLERLIALLETEHDYPTAIDYAQRLLRLDPLGEANYRRLMYLYALTGDRIGVERVYRACVTALRCELQVEPSANTRQMYEQSLRLAVITHQEVDSRQVQVARKTNLPVQLTRLIGRESEIEQVRQLILQQRLVTLTGMGGIGKTRLALAVAESLLNLDIVADGIWHVELGALEDPALVMQSVAVVLNVRAEGEYPLLKRLAEALGEKRLMLVLDNCEHLVAAVRPLTEALLSVAPQVRILATSRVALGAKGEVIWRVSPLYTPPRLPNNTVSQAASLDRSAEQVPILANYPSVQVFVDRAMTVLPTFALTNENGWAVGRICQQLGGIPLALELAAAWVKVLSAQQIADHLQDALNLLTQGCPDALLRHQSLQATLDWSFALLPPQQQILFRRLAVFASSFSLEAAEFVGSDENSAHFTVLEGLATLVNHSLVNVEPSGDIMRFRLHEITRQYGCRQLTEANEEQLVRNRHLDFFCRLSEGLEANLHGTLPQGAYERLTQEYDNLRAALEWSALREGDALLGLRLAAALTDYWEMRGHLTAERAWLEALLVRAGQMAQLPIRAKALRSAGKMAYYQCDFNAARTRFEQSLAIDRQLNNQARMADTLSRLGFLFSIQQNYASAEPLLQESLAIFRRLDDPSGVGRVLSELGYLALRQGAYAQARSLLEESLASLHKPADQYLEARARHFLGYTARLAGDYAQAHKHYRRAAILLKGMCNTWGLIYLLESFACLAAAEAQWKRAARLFGAVEQLRKTSGVSIVPSEGVEIEKAVASTHRELGERVFAEEWSAGRSFTLDEAIDYASE